MMAYLFLKTVIFSCLIQSAHLRVRQAPFCVNPDDQPNIRRFKPIIDYTNANPTKFIPVSPDEYESPTGFVTNITLTRIVANPGYIDKDHVWRKLHNFFHVTIKVVPQSQQAGMEGLFIQAIGAPLGIPIGEWVTDFDCGDCAAKTSDLSDITFQIPCSHVSAASFTAPTILSIGGDPAKPIRKFDEAHFNFRYVDYPCAHDVIYAQFLIIAVREFSPQLHYEVFYSPLYKVNIEGVGSPYPFYGGWETSKVLCHDPVESEMNNWKPQHSQKAKIKFSKEFEECMLGGTPLVPGKKICPPGPFWCGYKRQSEGEPIQTREEWAKYRGEYQAENNAGGGGGGGGGGAGGAGGGAAGGKGTHIFCKDCGDWEDKIGPKSWVPPPIVTVDDNITTDEKIITDGHKNTNVTYYNNSCPIRDHFGKNENGSRDRRKDAPDCERDFADALVNRGYRTGLKMLQLHGLIMVFAVIVGTNCLIYCGRFLKEATVVEKDSGCFGIGGWMIDHLFWTYIVFAALGTGVFLFGIMTRELMNITCYIYDRKEETKDCHEWMLMHIIIGAFAVLFYIIGFGNGWSRPMDKMLRNMWILFHILCGYLGKYLGLLTIYFIPDVFKAKEKMIILVSEIAFWTLFLVAHLIQRDMDHKTRDQIKDRACCFPTLEGVDTLKKPPMNKIRASLFPILVVVEIVLFVALCFFHFGEND